MSPSSEGQMELDLIELGQKRLLCYHCSCIQYFGFFTSVSNQDVTITVLVSWGMIIMSWHFYASFTVMIWTALCQTLVYTFNTVSWYYENKVEWHNCMQSLKCYSHLVLPWCLKKECVIIRLQNQESHNIGWQLTHMSLNIEFSLSLPMEKNFLKRKRFLYLSVCTEELHDLAFLLLPKCLISQYPPLFIFCIRFVW